MSNTPPPEEQKPDKQIAWWLTKLQVETVKNHRPVVITREDEEVLEKALAGITRLIHQSNNDLIREIERKLSAPKDMTTFEGIGKDGGIDTTIYDLEEDPRGVKNGEMLAHLAQFASDTGYNSALEEVKQILTNAIKGEK